MKIGQTNESLQTDLPARVGTRTANGNGPVPGAGTTESTDKVAISQTTRSLQGGSAGETFDALKVGAVRAAIERGEFRVNAEKVAEKMVAEAAELLERITTGGSQ